MTSRRFDVVFLDAGGVLVFPSCARVAATLAQYGLTTTAEALAAGEWHAKHDVDTRALGPWVLSLIVEGVSHELAVVRVGVGAYAVDWRGRSFEIELVEIL